MIIFCFMKKRAKKQHKQPENQPSISQFFSKSQKPNTQETQSQPEDTNFSSNIYLMPSNHEIERESGELQGKGGDLKLHTHGDKCKDLIQNLGGGQDDQDKPKFQQGPSKLVQYHLDYRLEKATL